MPGEQLVCIWQAAYTKNPKSTQITKDDLRALTQHFAILSSRPFNENKFNTEFSDTGIDFNTYKNYITEEFRERGEQDQNLYDKLEEQCWGIASPFYKTNVLNEKTTEKLWKIVNRLSTENTYPPTVCPEAVMWLSDKIATALSKVWQTDLKKKPVSVQDILSCLEHSFFADSPMEEVIKAIDSLYFWLVREIMKTGWMYKRTKKQSNWTGWTKRWVLLTPGRITYYNKESSSGSQKRGDFLLTSHTVLEPLEDYKGMVHKLHDRFKVSNVPYIEMEMAPADGSTIRRGWMSAIQELIDTAKKGTTPVQNLLHERYAHTREKIDSEKKAPNVEEQQVVKKLDELELRSRKATVRLLGRASNVGTPPSSSPVQMRKNNAAQKPSEPNEEDDSDNSKMIPEVQEKLKALFMQIDKDGNGKISLEEFSSFMVKLGLKMDQREIELIFTTIDKDKSGCISFQEFSEYFSNTIMSDDVLLGTGEARLRGAFLQADRDGTGTLNFKEFAEYLWEKKRSIRISKLFSAFSDMDESSKGEVSYDKFREYYKGRISDVPETITEEDFSEDGNLKGGFEAKLQTYYNETEGADVAKFIRDRWDKFATFKRKGAMGKTVMRGGHGMVADVVPGEYSLIDLACFSDLPPLIPKHTAVKGIKWISHGATGKSGKIIFPDDFNGKIVTDVATDEHLRYYGANFAEGTELKVSLLYRHGIQDFTYENKYLDDYVTATNGGAGIERHEFSHLDCPLEENSGTFIMAKLIGDDEIHITGFKVPIRHTLYIPSGVIHSNDYLTGTWRTMLSDETDIDHVHLVRQKDNEFEHFKFSFA